MEAVLVIAGLCLALHLVMAAGRRLLILILGPGPTPRPVQAPAAPAAAPVPPLSGGAVFKLTVIFLLLGVALLCTGNLLYCMFSAEGISNGLVGRLFTLAPRLEVLVSGVLSIISSLLMVPLIASLPDSVDHDLKVFLIVLVCGCMAPLVLCALLSTAVLVYQLGAIAALGACLFLILWGRKL